MYALISRDKIQLPPGTVVRMPGSWQDYRALCDSRGDGAIPRIKYRNGEILLMSPLLQHGRAAHILADIVKAILDQQNRNHEAFTPITMELPEAGGIEPDYCFYIDNWQAAVGRDRLNWDTDPAPVVIEINMTTYTDANDHACYGVPEVWLFKNQLAIYHLQDEAYEQQSHSRYFPEFDLSVIVTECLTAASERGTGVAIRELRQRLSTLS